MKKRLGLFCFVLLIGFVSAGWFSDLFGGGITGRVISTDGLVTYYDFDDNVQDSSGNNNHGTINGNPQYVNGKLGKSLQFDGDGDFVQISDSDDLRLQNMTISLWVYNNGDGDGTFVAKQRYANYDNSYAIYESGDILKFYSSGNDRTSGYALPSNNWTHVVVTVDGLNLKFYVNGVNQGGTKSVSKPFYYDATTPILIGADNDASSFSPSNFFTGMIDEVLVYNRAFSDSEVSQLYDDYVTPCVPDCSGKFCGDDGCGGSCGSCAGGQICSSGNCVIPAPCNDSDVDGYGLSGTDLSLCSGSKTLADCDDSNPSKYLLVNGYLDADGDGWTIGAAQTFCTDGALPMNYVSSQSGEDCDDSNSAINPGTIEGSEGDLICFDGVDNDCDLNVDGADSGCQLFAACSGMVCGFDIDGTGCGSCGDGYYCYNGDCVSKPRCEVSCSGRSCGGDGCGGSCGNCDSGYSCSNGNCIGISDSRITYYVAPNGSDYNNGLSKATPWRTLSYATSNMGGGNTLIVMAGVYNGTENLMTYTIPSGTVDRYTIIKADGVDEGRFDVLIDSVDNPDKTVGDNKYFYPVKILDRSFINIEGLRFKGGVGGMVIYIADRAHHIKVQKVGAIMMDGGSHAFETTGMACSNPAFADTPEGSGYWCKFPHDILFEDVWTSGQMRYGFLAGRGSWNILVRRAVIRFDYSTATEPLAQFAFYGPSHDSACQNCIAFDTNYYDDWGHRDGCEIRNSDGDITGWRTSSCFYYGGFYNPKASKDIEFVGSIALNTKSGAISSGFGPDDGGYDTSGNKVINSVAYDVLKEGLNPDDDIGDGIRARGSAGPTTISFNTIGKAGYGIRKSSGSVNSDHNLFIDNLLKNAVSSSDSDYFDNSPGTNDDYITPTNEQYGDSGLMYLPRSPLNASDGQPIGAVIEKRIGKAGTLKGEEGWNLTTSYDLWPWPYEDQIKEDFRIPNIPPVGAYPSTNDVKRGFAADGNGLYGGPITLTSYIWEYLNNSCPSDICNYGSGSSGGEEECVSTVPGDSDCSGCVGGDSELPAYLDRWFVGDAGVTIELVAEAIESWLSCSD